VSRQALAGYFLPLIFWTDDLTTKQIIFQDVIQKAESTSKKTDTLCVELDRTNCDLLNVSNHFTALANKQYIESRVADEEPVAVKPEPKEPTESTAVIFFNLSNHPNLINLYHRKRINMFERKLCGTA
jgi:hypothetical protein